MALAGPSHPDFQTPEYWQHTLDRVREGIQTLAPYFHSDHDIHTHTREIGETCRNLRLIERQQGWTSLNNLEQGTPSQRAAQLANISNEILRLSNHDANVERVLNSIKAQGDTLDNETFLNAPLLLISTWELAQQAPYAGAQGLIIDNLRHNYMAGGQCIQGINARLVSPYLLFLANVLNERIKNHFDPHATASSEPSEDRIEDDLARALELSLLEPKPHTFDGFDEDAQLHWALQASQREEWKKPILIASLSDSTSQAGPSRSSYTPLPVSSSAPTAVPPPVAFPRVTPPPVAFPRATPPSAPLPMAPPPRAASLPAAPSPAATPTRAPALTPGAIIRERKKEKRAERAALKLARRTRV